MFNESQRKLFCSRLSNAIAAHPQINVPQSRISLLVPRESSVFDDERIPLGFVVGHGIGVELVGVHEPVDPQQRDVGLRGAVDCLRQKVERNPEEKKD
jgi:hypothetical protein